MVFLMHLLSTITASSSSPDQDNLIYLMIPQPETAQKTLITFSAFLFSSFYSSMCGRSGGSTFRATPVVPTLALCWWRRRIFFKRRLTPPKQSLRSTYAMLLCLGPWAEGICWFGEQGALVMLGSAVQLNPAGLCSSILPSAAPGWNCGAPPAWDEQSAPCGNSLLR